MNRVARLERGDSVPLFFGESGAGLRGRQAIFPKLRIGIYFGHLDRPGKAEVALSLGCGDARMSAIGRSVDVWNLKRLVVREFFAHCQDRAETILPVVERNLVAEAD